MNGMMDKTGCYSIQTIFSSLTKEKGQCQIDDEVDGKTSYTIENPWEVSFVGFDADMLQTDVRHADTNE